jgi:hypothetical protein
LSSWSNYIRRACGHRYLGRPLPDAAASVAWLRAHVARFSTGEDQQRRALAVAELSRVDPGELGRRAAQRGLNALPTRRWRIS